MPYEIVYVAGDDRPWKVKNKETGKIVGSSKSYHKAKASVAIRLDAEKEKKKHS